MTTHIGFKPSFSERLSEAISARGWAQSPSFIARQFNLRWRGNSVSVNAVRKWMVGDAIPTSEKLQVLADLLGVASEWLRWGDDQQLSVRESRSDYERRSWIALSAVTSLSQDVRLLDDSHLRLVQALVSAMLQEQKNKREVSS